jgi:hypothetical protein
MMNPGSRKDGWRVFQNALKAYLTANGYQCDKDGFRFTLDSIRCFVLPLEDLIMLKKLRSDEGEDYESPAIFLINADYQYPELGNPNLPFPMRELLLGNPQFGSISRAIFCAEIMPFREEDRESLSRWTLREILSWQNPYVNILNVINVGMCGLLPDFVEELIGLVDCLNNLGHRKYRRMFYQTFVNYYDRGAIDIAKPERVSLSELNLEIDNETLKPLGNSLSNASEDSGGSEDLKMTSGSFEARDLLDFLTFTDKLYCYLNRINYAELTHRVPHELFRAPVAFPLHELLDARRDIEGDLARKGKRKNKKITLLLIDNRPDKFIHSGKAGPLCGLITDLHLDNIFQLKTLGRYCYQDTSFWKYENDSALLCNAEDIDLQSIQFDWWKFTRLNPRSDDDYRENVYKEVANSDFILLDFFLNEGSYLAFDFIKEINYIKKENEDYSTVWYFITSAIHDSVMKYSTSGLLAEYYEWAVVSSGDDPTNERRHIILAYKLLTFVQARLLSFRNLEAMIQEKFKGCRCLDDDKRSCKKRQDLCLHRILSLTKKYLAEHEEASKIFGVDDKHFKDIVEVLDNLIKQFLWLPAADWQIVQHQIDFINAKLRYLNDQKGEPMKFFCSHIIEELRRRSQLY